MPGHRARFEAGQSGRALRVGANLLVPTLARALRETLTDVTVYARVLLSADAPDYEWDRTFLSLGRFGDDAEDNGWSLGFTGERTVELFTETDVGANHNANLAFRPALGEWVDLVVVISGDRATAYVNGEAGQAVPYQPAELVTDAASIGGYGPRGGSAFVGLIDDLAVWAGQVPVEAHADLAPQVVGNGPGPDRSPLAECNVVTPCEPTPAPLARWTFDGDDLGEARGGPPAVAVGEVRFTEGIAGGAGEVVGEGAYYLVDGVAEPLRNTLDSCTVAMWINPRSRYEGVRYHFTLGSSGDGLANIFWALRESSRILEYTYEDRLGINIQTKVGVRPPVDVWTHVAFTFEGRQMRYFVNGVRAWQADLEVPRTTTEHAAIGGWWNSDDRSQPARYDEVRIYDVPLNQAQIRQLVADPDVDDCPGAVVDGACVRRPLLAHWNFDDNLEDDSGNGHHAVPVPGYRARFEDGVSGRAVRFGPALLAPTLAPAMRATLTDMTVYMRVRLAAAPSPDEWDRTVLALGRDSDLAVENGWGLRFSRVAFELFTEVGAPGLSQVVEIGSGADLGQWVDVVSVFDGDFVTTYVGGRAGRRERYQPADTMTETAVIGAFSQTGHAPFVGLLDDLAIWEGGVEEGEIPSLAPVVVGAGPGNDDSPLVTCDEQTPCAPPPAPLARWRFDDNHDAARGGVAVRPVGNIGFAAGVAGGAAVIHDGDARLEVDGIAAALADTLDSCTVAMWVRPSAHLDTFRYLFSLGTGGPDIQPNNFWSLRISDRTLDFTFEEPGLFLETRLGVRPPVDVWTHLALVADDGVVSLYVNGVLHATHDRPVPVVATLRAGIGSMSTVDGRSIPGAYDEVRIYAAALSVEQVRQLVADPDVDDP